MKKAKLDILEDIPGIEPEMSEDQIPLTHGDKVPVVSEGKWAFNKLLLIGAPLALGALIVGGVLAYYLIHKISPDPQTPQIISKTSSQAVRQDSGRAMPETAGKKQNISAQSLALPEKTTILYFKDFMIDLKDANGNTHVLMCDVVFDIGGEQKHNELENVAVLRNIIYKTAQARSVVALRSVEERKKLKKDLAFALEKIMGEGSVKNVFFTSYLIM